MIDEFGDFDNILLSDKITGICLIQTYKKQISAINGYKCYQ